MFFPRHVILGFWLFSATLLPAQSDLPWVLGTQAQVSGDGVFLDQLVLGAATNAVAHVRLCDSPAFGRTSQLPLTQIKSLLGTLMPSLNSQVWAGTASITISRRSRLLPASEVLEGLTSYFQKQVVRETAELELRLLRAWNPAPIADEVYTLRVTDLPPNGLTSTFSVRFELVSERESLGIWQVPLEARLWKQVWIGKDSLKRGDAISLAQVELERRDVLKLRDLLPSDLDWDRGWQLTEPLVSGQPIMRRALQLRPVVQRGQVVDALLRDGAVTISLKAEALELGTPGQIIRLRNPISRREIRGKVINEQMVHIQL